VSPWDIIKPWLQEEWCIPTVGSEFVWHRSDVLDLYAEPYESKRPTICVDERPVQLIGDVREPIPLEPGQVKRVDSEYKRNGTCNIFGCFEPHSCWRYMSVTERRTKKDFAQFIKELVDIYYKDAELIRIIVDNLNTHTPAALYEAFDAEEARRIAKKIEFRYTPKHGSWLNQVEIEFSVLSRQCLDRRIENIEELSSEVAAWSESRNKQQASINWRFTTENARVKLHRLYPSKQA
jgi:transposase